MNELPPVPSDSFLSRAWSAYRACLAKENYARLSGRSSRFEYWSATIIGSFFCLLPLLFTLILPNILTVIVLLLWLALIVYLAMPLLAVYVRRLHDVGWSGWWITAYYAIVIVVYTLFVFHVTQACYYLVDSIDEVLKEVLSSMLPVLRYTHLPMELLSLLLFIVTLLPGTKGRNKYGEPV